MQGSSSEGPLYFQFIVHAGPVVGIILLVRFRRKLISFFSYFRKFGRLAQLIVALVGVFAVYTPIYLALNAGKERVPFSFEDYFTRLGLVLTALAVLGLMCLAFMAILALAGWISGGTGGGSGDGEIYPNPRPGWENIRIGSKKGAIYPSPRPGFRKIIWWKK